MDRDPCAICLEQVRTRILLVHAPHTRTSTHSIDLHHIDYSNIFLSPKKSTAVYLLEILTCLLLCCLLPTTTSVDVDTFGEEAVFETANHLRDEVLQVRLCKTY